MSFSENQSSEVQFVNYDFCIRVFNFKLIVVPDMRSMVVKTTVQPVSSGSSRQAWVIHFVRRARGTR